MGFRSLAVVCAVAMTVAGCGTFEYSLPKVDQASSIDFQSMRTVAAAYREKYVERAGDLANSSQYFDLASMAGGVAGVYSIIFRGSIRQIEALTAGTAASYGLGSYYATKARAMIYFNGSAAMQCVADLASQAEVLFPGADTNNTIKLLAALKSGVDEPGRSILEPVFSFRTNGVFALGGAIDIINGKVLAASMSASSAPDLAALRASLLAQVQDAVTKQQAFNAAVSNPKSIRGLTERDVDDLQKQITFVAQFNASIAVCTSKVA